MFFSHIRFFCITTACFFVLFTATSLFFASDKESEQETYNSILEHHGHISDDFFEPELTLDDDEQDEKTNPSDVPLSSALDIKFIYFPATTRELYSVFEEEVVRVFSLPSFSEKISSLKVRLFSQSKHTRGMMKDKTISLYKMKHMPRDERMSVFLHEFGHYVDIHFFEKQLYADISDQFYDISWQSLDVQKPGSKKGDFVSGYALTNKYEDFAETFLYYIFHNEDFFEKTGDSQLLYEKYVFIEEKVLGTNLFAGSDFSSEKIQNYYWDITKISVDLEKFFAFLETSL